VSPVTEQRVAPEVVQYRPPGLEVTVKFVMGLPWFAGAVQLTEADASPTITVTSFGVPGIPGVTSMGSDAGPLP
jgi:hypothetical protein